MKNRIKIDALSAYSNLLIAMCDDIFYTFAYKNKKYRMRLLLLPLTLIYGAIMLLRNKLYDCGILAHKEFSRPVICVGNITVGGTGKTPFIEYLLRLLSDRRLAIVSRGYRRSTKGLVVATESSTVADIGDEPCQMHEKYPLVPMVVDEDRAEAIQYAIDHLDAGVVLMDDGYQHRKAKAGMYVLMTDYARPMWSDWTFPAGNMREPWKAGRKRAALVVVNKCPANLSVAERDAIRQRLNVQVPVFFTAIDYGQPHTLKGDAVDISFSKVIALAGIGRPDPFFEEVERRSSSVVRKAFPDHYQFSEDDVRQLLAESRQTGATIVTTEKDAKRLQKFMSIVSSDVENIIYLPIELRVLFDEAQMLNTKILQYVG